MKKRTFAIFGLALSLVCPVGTAGAVGVENLKSSLELVCDEDFENYYDGYAPKDFVCDTGRCRVSVAEEDGNKFVRIKNSADREARVVYTLAKSMSGRVVVEYDSRAAFVSICDMPAVLGRGKDGSSMQEVARVRITESGRVQVNQTQSNVYETSKSIAEWKHNVIIIDTDSDTCYFEYGGEEIGTYPSNVAGSEISKLRFASRITDEWIDIDNLKVYYDNASAIETGGNENDNTEGIAMPVRYYRKPAAAYEINENISIDGDLSENDWKISKRYNLCNIGQGTPLADTAFSVMRDGSGIYLGVWIYDKILNDIAPEGQGWLRDQVEVYIDGKNNHGNIYDDDDRQYSYGLRCESPDAHNSEQKRMGENMKYAQKETDYGWNVEMYIPFADICDKKYAVGDIIGFDVAYNDSNSQNVRAGQLLWRGTSQNSSITNVFGDLLLAEGKAGCELSEADKTAADTMLFEAWNRYALVNGIRRKINQSHASVTPRSMDGVIYLPFRFTLEELGYKVSYDGTAGEIKAETADDSIVIKASAGTVIRKGNAAELKNTLEITDDFLYLSAEDISRLTDTKVTIGSECVILGAENVSDETVLQIKDMKNTK